MMNSFSSNSYQVRLLASGKKLGMPEQEESKQCDYQYISQTLFAFIVIDSSVTWLFKKNISKKII